MVLDLRRLGPRLITVTHHDAVAGPYHRNARQIIDVMQRLARRRGAGAPRSSREYRQRLSADLPEHVDLDHLHGRGAEGLLHAAGAAARCRPGCSRSQLPEGFAVQDVAGGRLGSGEPGRLRSSPSITNWAASAARITPRMRVIIASSLAPISRISGPASEQREQGQQDDRGQRGEHDQPFGRGRRARRSAA